MPNFSFPSALLTSIDTDGITLHFKLPSYFNAFDVEFSEYINPNLLAKAKSSLSICVKLYSIFLYKLFNGKYYSGEVSREFLLKFFLKVGNVYSLSLTQEDGYFCLVGINIIPSIPFYIEEESDSGEETESDDESGDDDACLYTINKILTHRFEPNGTVYFKVSWEGYPSEEDNTWEPYENICHCSDAIKNYFIYHLH
jgi:hypothetical protein